MPRDNNKLTATLKDGAITLEPLFLSRAELIALTGYKQSPRMVMWLTKRNWIFESPSRAGQVPRVARHFFLMRMSLLSNRDESAHHQQAPDLSFFQRGGFER
jgi:Domain of unknown function (DUF4224)